ncbi:DUF998 domain-containing protein [Nonomuraea phyllanthi]|uniref:DUF998 domain-containing protein n=1 Tax=Nonomuraea phyllanthi TaxID=2219224 RepID=A0A5C4WTX4_9ACTN|nr:DUF998 domain-containing protein [Nonomuraea phyllanthi]KAB8196337.1 DUF998 domain-containing protein [Nonomuraea phyllanthi]QFY05365.1 DUF998 domain-containing protein [Nonomuraea phyllanthi]
MTGNLTTTTMAAGGTTRTLLMCGAAAGPLYIVVVLLQMLTRDGFDISRHPASMLSNGDQGWIQVANFVVSGLLFVAGAVGLHRVRDPAGGGAWGPRLVGVFGAGMVGAAFFAADPADGFPPGTPLGPPTTMSTSGMVHLLVAGLAFLALIAACFVFGRRFAAAGRRGRAAVSTVTGALFLAAWISVFASQGSRVANVAFALAIALVLAWTSLLAAYQLGRPGAATPD